MWAPQSPFGSYKSKQILFFANLFFPRFQDKKRNIFEIGFKNCEVIVQSLSKKKYCKINN